MDECNKKLDLIDVCIIGGSIAGNLIASLIASENVDIHVFEEHKNVGLPMECAGIVSSKIMDLIKIPANLILNSVEKAKFFDPHGEQITVKARDRPIILDRVGLDRHFYEIAKSGGVIYHLGEKVMGIERNKKYVTIKSNKGIYMAKLVVGCDGARSLVARYNGIKHDTIIGKQFIVKLPVDLVKRNMIESDACELHFDTRWTDLFGWVVPEGLNSFRIGIAAKKHVAKIFKTFITKRFNKKDLEMISGREHGIDVKITGGLI
ncbi:MAG: NAD(P)/FAD-dependent oxidoreductase, partial [Promethearchaeota archaeon]